MAEKRTKADKAQRQADQLEKKARHPAPKKKRKRSRGAADWEHGDSNNRRFRVGWFDAHCYLRADLNLRNIIFR